MKNSSTIIWVVLTSAICLGVAYRVWLGLIPGVASFRPMTPQAFAGLIGWLLAVTLFVERAVEVVVMVLRDQKADLLEDAEEQAGDNLKRLNGSATASQGEKETAAKELADVRQSIVTYRAQTKEIALQVGFVFGLILSFAGVRALHGLLLPDGPSPGRLFTLADILVTGAMLAGGSEGIHRMTNAFSSVMDSFSAQADASQRAAADKLKNNS